MTRKTIRLEVVASGGCSGCPWYQDTEWREICGRESRTITGASPPDWCPLRTQDVLVTLAFPAEEVA